MTTSYYKITKGMLGDDAPTEVSCRAEMIEYVALQLRECANEAWRLHVAECDMVGWSPVVARSEFIAMEIATMSSELSNALIRCDKYGNAK